ncbi:MAG: hypothetical protein KIS77_17950 [Saprospiraceae bacterium]|nr:hypothetical protein [Saprospiraceae bacterium]
MENRTGLSPAAAPSSASDTVTRAGLGAMESREASSTRKGGSPVPTAPQKTVSMHPSAVTFTTQPTNWVLKAPKPPATMLPLLRMPTPP